MKKLLVVFSFMILLALVAAPASHAADGDAVLGKWQVIGGKAIVEIYKCQDKYCGKIVWLREPNNEAGQPKTDEKNPDEAKRNRPMLGIIILWGLKYVGDNKYEDGGIYAADSGKTYNSKMELKGDKLDVRGFKGISLLGRTDTWTRVK